MKKLIKQIFRFLFVGGTAFILDFGVLWFLTEVGGINYLLSNVLSFAISTIYNYILSVMWVFDVQNSRGKKRNFIFFVLLSIVGLGINQLIMFVSVEMININYLLAKIIATIIVMIFNFVTRKMFLERGKQQGDKK